MFDYLLAPEQDLVSLTEKQQFLWKSVRRLSNGEDPMDVARDIISAQLLSKSELRAWSSWLKKNPPKLKKRPIDAYRGK